MIYPMQAHLHRAVIISREKYFTHGMNAEWRWLYSVTPVQGRPVSIGTTLAEAILWAKRHSQNANEIVQVWDSTRIPMPKYGEPAS